MGSHVDTISTLTTCEFQEITRKNLWNACKFGAHECQVKIELYRSCSPVHRVENYLYTHRHWLHNASVKCADFTARKQQQNVTRIVKVSILLIGIVEFCKLFL